MCDDVGKGGVDASRDKNAEEMQPRCSDESSRHRMVLTMALFNS